MVILLFLLFRVVLGLWNDTVPECLINELQSPEDLTLRTDIRTQINQNLETLHVAEGLPCCQRQCPEHREHGT